MKTLTAVHHPATVLSEIVLCLRVFAQTEAALEDAADHGRLRGPVRLNMRQHSKLADTLSHPLNICFLTALNGAERMSIESFLAKFALRLNSAPGNQAGTNLTVVGALQISPGPVHAGRKHMVART